MGLLDTWKEVRQQIIDSKPTYEPFITPKEYVSPFYADTPEPTVEAALAPSAPVYDQGLLYKRPLNLPTDSDEPQQPTTYEPVETTKQLTNLMGQTPTVNALSAILPGGILLTAAHRREIQNAANRIFGENLEGGKLTFGDVLPFFGDDYEKRIRDTISYGPKFMSPMPAYPMDWYEESAPPPQPAPPPPMFQSGVAHADPHMFGGPDPVGDWDYAPSYDPDSASFVDWAE